MFLHIVFFYELHTKNLSSEKPHEEDYITIDITDSEKDSLEDHKMKRILETPLEPTEQPEKADFYGQTDHIAKKEQKAKVKNITKGKDPKPQQASPAPQKQERVSRQTPVKKSGESKDFVENSDKALEGDKVEDKSEYERFLAESFQSFANEEIRQGYVDHLEDEFEEGDFIDMNTQEYRFIGYFTNMRKAIELVWVYPIDAARRGIYGRVLVKFVILANGQVSKVRVVESSGHKSLDGAIINAIEGAAPFAPLPEGFEREKLPVSGAFSYVLSSY